MSEEQKRTAESGASEQPEAAGEKQAKAPPKAEASEPKASRSRAQEAKAEETAEEKPKRAKAEAAEEKPKRSSRKKAELEPAADAPEAQGDAEEQPKRRPARRRAAETTTSQRRAPARRDGEGAVVVRAQARFVRCAPRKARLVIDHIRGKSVDEARAILTHTPRAAARDVMKLLNSAIANAEHNHELVADDLVVKQAYVDEGPTLKRYRPRALGRATRIRKRTSHLTITLSPKE